MLIWVRKGATYARDGRSPKMLRSIRCIQGSNPGLSSFFPPHIEGLYLRQADKAHKSASALGRNRIGIAGRWITRAKHGDPDTADWTFETYTNNLVRHWCASFLKLLNKPKFASLCGLPARSRRDKGTAGTSAFNCQEQIRTHPALEDITVGPCLQGRGYVVLFLVHTEKYDFGSTPDLL